MTYAIQCIRNVLYTILFTQDFQERSALSLRNCPLGSSVSGGSRARYTAVSAPAMMNSFIVYHKLNREKSTCGSNTSYWTGMYIYTRK